MISKDRQKGQLPRLIVNINWARILAFVTFWVYGYYGAISSPQYPLISLIFTILSLLILIYFIILDRKVSYFHDKLSLSNTDILVFSIYLLALLLLSFDYLTNDITLDQLYHAQSSQIHAIALINFLSAKFLWLNDITFLTLIRLVDLLLILFFLGIYLLLRKGTVTSVIILSLVFIISRFIVYNTFKGTEPHPQFRLFPLWLTSSLFGVNSIGFRIASLIGLALLMWTIFRISYKHNSCHNSFLLGMTCGTIPVLLHAGTIVEPSIWAGLIFVPLLLTICQDDRSKEIPWARWFSIATIFFLMRQTVVAAIVFLLLLFFYEFKDKEPLAFRRKCITLSPIIVMTFIFIKSLYWGTPGSTIPNDTQASALQRVLESVVSGVSLDILLNMFHLSLIGFLVFAFIPVGRGSVSGAILRIIFFSMLYGMFYAAAPQAWGTGRYQAEYIVPFIIYGLYRFTSLLDKRRFGKTLASMILILVGANNIYAFVNMPKEGNIIGQTGHSIISTEINNYTQILKALKDDGISEKVFLFEPWTYGAFPQIVSGYSVKEVKTAWSRFDKYCVTIGGVCSVESVNSDEGIDVVIIDERNQIGLEIFKDYQWHDVSNHYARIEYSRYVMLVRRARQ